MSQFLKLLADMPDKEERVIVVYPEKANEFVCRWVGMTPENVVRTLYAMADLVMKEKIPVYDLSKKQRGL